MFVNVTTVKMPKAAMSPMLEAFRHGAPELKRFPGFLGFELWTSDDTLQAVAKWESREAMDAYVKSDMFKAHHGGAQPGASAASFDAEKVV